MVWTGAIVQSASSRPSCTTTQTSCSCRRSTTAPSARKGTVRSSCSPPWRPSTSSAWSTASRPSPRPTRSRHDRQIELLAGALGYEHFTYQPNVPVKQGHYGNAILSRYNLLDTHNIDITTPPKKKRGVVYARQRIDLDTPKTPPSRTLHIYNMHLGLSQIERKIQLRRFLDSHPFQGLHADTPIIVGGDLNDVYGNLGAKLLGPAGFRTWAKPQATFPAYAPMRALDGLYLRGSVELVSLERSRLKIARQASDHLPLVADLIIH